VPVGSVEKGRQIAERGTSGPTTRCETCHGPGLKGLADVPNLAGRSPSYLVRQLYDFQHGMRAGDANELMKPIVASLTMGDTIALAAYAASLKP